MMAAALVVIPVIHVAGAQLAGATYGLDPELLLAIAEHESGWDSSARNGWACGPMQVATTDPARCIAMTDTVIGYLEGARELRRRVDIARGDIAAALRLYGCGWAKVDGELVRPAQIPATCNGFDGWVIRHRDLISKQLDREETT